MELKELGIQANKTAQEKGFWEMYDNIGLAFVQQTPITAEQLKWIEGQHIAVKIALCITELGEAIEALRKDKIATKNRVTRFKSECTKEDFEVANEKFTIAFEKYIKDTEADELGDTYVRLGDLCHKLEIDIDFHIKMKMRYNETRSKMHGKSY